LCTRRRRSRWKKSAAFFTWHSAAHKTSCTARGRHLGLLGRARLRALHLRILPRSSQCVPSLSSIRTQMRTSLNEALPQAAPRSREECFAEQQICVLGLTTRAQPALDHWKFHSSASPMPAVTRAFAASTRATAHMHGGLIRAALMRARDSPAKARQIRGYIRALKVVIKTLLVMPAVTGARATRVLLAGEMPSNEARW
jgi:hypothetical protein